MWPSDLVLRAATAPAMTTSPAGPPSWCKRWSPMALRALGPASAGAQLLQQGLVLSFEGHGTISAPGLVAEYGNAGFVAEGQPIPVRQLADHCSAAPAAQARGDRRAHPRDGRVFQCRGADRRCADARRRPHARRGAVRRQSANASIGPAGLRNGVAALTPSANTDPFGAFFEDVATLINSLAPVAGNGPYALVAAPGRAAAMQLRFISEESNVKVYGSNAVINDLLAIAPGALVAALAPEPESRNIEGRHAGDGYRARRCRHDGPRALAVPDRQPRAENALAGLLGAARSARLRMADTGLEMKARSRLPRRSAGARPGDRA